MYECKTATHPQVLWSAELAYLTVVLADSVTSQQLQSLNPPTQDFPLLEPELQKRKKLAPTNFLTQKFSTKTRDLRHFQIRDKIA